jgi:hypothetical protein
MAACQEQGSDYGLLRAGYLVFRRGDVARAKTILGVGVARRLTLAMTYLAWLELRISRAQEARGRARGLYEQAIALGDLSARMKFARAMARGHFGLGAVPTGIRSLLATAKEFSEQVDARSTA